MKRFTSTKIVSLIMALVLSATLTTVPSLAKTTDDCDDLMISDQFTTIEAYEGNNIHDATISVQDKFQQETYVGTQTKITIESAKASRQYTYRFNLSEGQKIIESSDYRESDGVVLPSGGICIVDKNNQLLNYIEAPKATDSLGENIKTFYIVEKNCIIQEVEFDELSAFPVVIESNSHPTITTTAKISKSKTKSVINKIQSQIDDANNFTGSFVYWIITASGGYLGGFGIAADAITTWMVKPTFVKRLKARKTLYSGKYNQMASGDKLKVVSVRRWQPHGGNDGRYVLKKETLSIIH